MDSFSKRALAVWAGVLLAVAFAVAFRATHDLTWPCEHDFYREMASARSLQQEGFGHDPCYRGETVWYNPLASMALAGAQRVTGLPLPVVAARAGTYLNLLGPLAFLLLAVRLLGRGPGLLALAGYLFFVGGTFPSWAAATYSPWLYPVNFAQFLFYLLAARLLAAPAGPPSLRWSLGTGLLLGVMFLGHTAPTLLFAGLLLCWWGWPAWQARGRRLAELRRLYGPGLVVGLAAAVVAAPYLASLIGHYRLHILNPLPSGYVPDFLGLSHVPLMILRHLEPPILVAGYGLWLVGRGRCAAPVRRLLLPWLGLTGLGVLYGYVAVGASKVGVRLPQVVPAFHFLFYFKAAAALLCAVGLADLAQRCAGWLASRAGVAAAPWAVRLGLTFAAVLALINLPGYLSRYDFAQAPAESRGHAAERDRIALYNWLCAHGWPDHVVLAGNDLALFGVAPAGPNVVAVDPYMASPYVDAGARNAARDRMYATLAAGEAAAFRGEADVYAVTHVVVESPVQSVHPSLVGSLLREVLVAGRIRLYEVIEP